MSDLRRIRVGAPDARGLLTRSELDVLVAAANGLTSAETGRALGKATQTVKTQRGQTLLKLGARNMAQAVGIARARGLLETEPAAV